MSQSFDGIDILTSANIDSGNSGGLAIGRGGCFMGIPYAVSEGESSNLGAIIPSGDVYEFLERASLAE